MDIHKGLIHKILVIGIILLFVFMGINSSIAVNNIKKSPTPTFDGNILYVGGSGERNYSKIQNAINDASDGDTVFVYDDSSPYKENVIVDKSIKLLGENRNTTLIKSYGKIIQVNANKVQISGGVVPVRFFDECDEETDEVIFFYWKTAVFDEMLVVYAEAGNFIKEGCVISQRLKIADE